MTSAQIIREARLRVGLTQQELAERARTTQSAIARWESGTTQPSWEVLRRLLACCGLDLEFRLVPVDAERDGQLLANLRLTPTQRLNQLVRTTRFIHAGRRGVAR